jgi:hypothetical protein
MQINPQMQALDFGFRCIRFFGEFHCMLKIYFLHKEVVSISQKDRHLFSGKIIK